MDSPFNTIDALRQTVNVQTIRSPHWFTLPRLRCGMYLRLGRYPRLSVMVFGKMFDVLIGSEESDREGGKETD